jgi:error-prone DNA polymerase
MFITLEDETGQVNVIIHRQLVDREQKTLLQARLLGVIGTWQTNAEVHHLLAGRLVDESQRLSL